MTNYSLNPQEKRKHLDGSFGRKALELSQLDFWNQYKVFSPSDVRRMRDIEYCCSIYILANEFIVEQTSQIKINNYYEDFKEDFDKDKKLENKINCAMEFIKKLIDKSSLQFASKKIQMYTLFCVAFKIYDKKIEYNNLILIKFKLFAEIYNKFRNEIDIEFKDTEDKYIFDEIKKYKLASSEGVNKQKNRMIRFEILYKLCIEGDENVIVSLKNILKKIEIEKYKITDINIDKLDSEDNEQNENE